MEVASGLLRQSRVRHTNVWAIKASARNRPHMEMARNVLALVCIPSSFN